MEEKLFVAIMTIGGENINTNHSFGNFINQAVLLADATAPQRSITTNESFWLSCTCLRMIVKLCYQLKCLLVELRFMFTKTIRSC